MATPAASAWHRRRQILPKSAVRMSAPPRSSPPASEQTFNNHLSHIIASPRPSSSTTSQPISTVLHNLLTPLLTHVEASFVRSLIIVFLSLLLTRFLHRLPLPLAPFFMPCNTIPPRHFYPLSLFFFKIVAFSLNAITLLTVHFLFAHLETAYRRHPSLRIRLLHMTGTLSALVLQTIFLTYMIHGPSLIPYSLTPAMCTHATEYYLLPTWQNLVPQTTVALLAALGFSFLCHLTAAHSKVAFPFRVSIFRNAMQHVPRVMFLSVFPSLVSLFPTAALIYLLPSASLGWYPAIVHATAKLYTAFSTTVVVLLSWNILAVLSKAGSLAAQSDIEMERDHFLIMIHETFSAEPDDIRPILYSLQRLIAAPYMSNLPVFTDASGEIWRGTLSMCLSPITSIYDQLHAFNMRSQSAVPQLTGPLFLGPSKPKLPTAAAAFLGVGEILCSEEVECAIDASRILSKIYVASYKADTFGVVHRFLPKTLAQMLKCKQQTTLFLDEHERIGEDWKRGGQMMQICRQALRLCGDYDFVIAVDDALSLSIYQITGAYQEHLQSYLNGQEENWDRNVSGMLQAFLEFRVP